MALPINQGGHNSTVNRPFLLDDPVIQIAAADDGVVQADYFGLDVARFSG